MLIVVASDGLPWGNGSLYVLRRRLATIGRRVLAATEIHRSGFPDRRPPTQGPGTSNPQPRLQRLRQPDSRRDRNVQRAQPGAQRNAHCEIGARVDEIGDAAALGAEQQVCRRARTAPRARRTAARVVKQHQPAGERARRRRPSRRAGRRWRSRHNPCRRAAARGRPRGSRRARRCRRRRPGRRRAEGWCRHFPPGRADGARAAWHPINARGVSCHRMASPSGKMAVGKGRVARLSGPPSRPGPGADVSLCPGTLKDVMAAVETNEGAAHAVEEGGVRRRDFINIAAVSFAGRRRRRPALSAGQPDEPVGRRARARPDRRRHLGDPAGPGDQDDLAQAADLHPQPDPGRDQAAANAVDVSTLRDPQTLAERTKDGQAATG